MVLPEMHIQMRFDVVAESPGEICFITDFSPSQSASSYNQQQQASIQARSATTRAGQGTTIGMTTANATQTVNGLLPVSNGDLLNGATTPQIQLLDSNSPSDLKPHTSTDELARLSLKSHSKEDLNILTRHKTKTHRSSRNGTNDHHHKNGSHHHHQPRCHNKKLQCNDASFESNDQGSNGFAVLSIPVPKQRKSLRSKKFHDVACGADSVNNIPVSTSQVAYRRTTSDRDNILINYNSELVQSIKTEQQTQTSIIGSTISTPVPSSGHLVAVSSCNDVFIKDGKIIRVLERKELRTIAMQTDDEDKPEIQERRPRKSKSRGSSSKRSSRPSIASIVSEATIYSAIPRVENDESSRIAKVVQKEFISSLPPPPSFIEQRSPTPTIAPLPTAKPETKPPPPFIEERPYITPKHHTPDQPLWLSPSMPRRTAPVSADSSESKLQATASRSQGVTAQIYSSPTTTCPVLKPSQSTVTFDEPLEIDTAYLSEHKARFTQSLKHSPILKSFSPEQLMSRRIGGISALENPTVLAQSAARFKDQFNSRAKALEAKLSLSAKRQDEKGAVDRLSPNLPVSSATSPGSFVTASEGIASTLRSSSATTLKPASKEASSSDASVSGEFANGRRSLTPPGRLPHYLAASVRSRTPPRYQRGIGDPYIEAKKRFMENLAESSRMSAEVKRNAREANGIRRSMNGILRR